MPALLGFCGAALASPQVGGGSIPRDQMMGRWMNFEVAPIHPIEFDPAGELVYHINQPGSRVIARRRATQGIEWEAPMGVGLSSLRLRRGNNELWCVDRVSHTVSVLDLATGEILRSIRVGAEPHDLVFSGNQDRAYVTCSAAGRVDVVRTSDYTVVQSIDIPAMHPRGIERIGSRIFVVPFTSGNGSAPMGNAATGNTQDVRTVENVAQVPGATPLPDRDLFVIEVGASIGSDALNESATMRGLGTMLYNIHRRPGTTELWIPHTDALNVENRGEKSFIAGQVVRNRIAIVDGPTSTLIDTIDLDALAPQPEDRCAAPSHVGFTPDGSRAFVTGYGSDSLATLDVGAGTIGWAGSIDIKRARPYPDGAGPRAAEVDPQAEYLWIHNKGDNTYVRVELADLPTAQNFAYESPKARLNGWDPTPADINQGRIHFIRTENSLSQTSSCDSCHLDGHTDFLAWDLSNYLDPEGTAPDQLAFPLDIKGPLVTQSLRHLREVGPFHWRGEKKQLQEFDDSFMTLLERHDDNDELRGIRVNFRYVSQYLEHLTIPSNPRQRADRTYTQEQLDGADIFMNHPVRDDLRCVDCHALPLGTAGEIVDHLDGGLSPTIVVPALRGVQDKLAPEFEIGGPFGTRTELGAGLTHNGNAASIAGHIDSPLSSGARRFMLDPAQVYKVSSFLKALDTGLAPATAFQITVHEGNEASALASEIPYLISQANVRNCDLVYRYGPVDYQGSPRHMTGTFDRATGRFLQASETLPSLSLSELLEQIDLGHPVTLVGVPRLMGQPLGIDRDNDKLLDLDELARGTDPENDDTDNDGLPDGYEVEWTTNPLQPNSTIADTTPPQVIGSARIVYVTTNAIKFELTTDEPTRMYIGYNDTGPFLRAPLFPKHDTEFSEVVGDLKPGTDYTMQLNLNDPAGNSVIYEFEVRTKDFVEPVPAHVQDIQLSLAARPGNPLMRASIKLREGNQPAYPGYNIRGSVYFESANGLTLVASGLQTWLTNPNGIAHLYVTIPPSITPGNGRLHFAIDEIVAPPGRAPYAVGENMVMTDSMQF